jgi:hypothetical protein
MSDLQHAPPGSGSVRASWLVYGAALALTVLRAPQLLVDPRFWAEEGSVYYAVALRQPWPEALFHLPRDTAGYLLLSASVPATVAAKLLPLELGPFATTYAALAVLSVALALLAFGRSLLWNDPTRRGLACLVVLLAPSSVGEVWLNSTNSQVYCGLISLCILCEDLRSASSRRIAAYLLLLLFCGLSGVYTSFLFLAFVWKIWFERSRGAWLAGGVVAATAVAQFAIFLLLWNENAIHASKFRQIDWVQSGTYTFYTQFMAPLGGRSLVQEVMDPARVVYGLAGDWGGPASAGIALLGMLGVVAVLSALVDRDLRSPRNALVIAVGSLAILTTVSAKFGRTTGRYAVLSGISLLWLLLAHTYLRRGAPPWRALCASVLLFASLGVGGVGYRRDAAFACPGGCPRWRDEVAHWRRDPTYPPQIWPVLFPRTGRQWRVDVP